MLARLQQSEIAHAAEVDSLTAQILQLKIDAACKVGQYSSRLAPLQIYKIMCGVTTTCGHGGPVFPSCPAR
jgi:hypothetical protein